MDTQATITRSAKRFFSGTLLSRCSGLGREVLMAAAFGTAPAVAAFWMAFRFAHLLRRLFGEGALHTAFVPHFESLRAVNPQKAARFFYDLSSGVTFVLLLLIVLIEGTLGSLLLFVPLRSGNKEVIELTMILLPAIIFISLYALNCSFLNCERSYFLPSAAPIALNLVWMAAVLFLWQRPTHEAMRSLSLFLLFAFVLQWLVTLPRVIKLLSFPYNQESSWREILRILRPFFLGMIGVTATQINSALDAIFARIADPEGPAYLWYALRLQQLPLALFGVGMAGALLPPLSRAIQEGNHEKSSNFFKMATRQIFELMLPLSFAILLLGGVSIQLVYGHGKFGEEAVFQTTRCLWAYGVGLIPMSLVLIFAAPFYARKNYMTPTLISLGAVALNVVLNALFVFVFHLGAVSIAIATSISALANAAALYLLQKERIEWFNIGKLMVAALSAFAVLYYLPMKGSVDSFIKQLLFLGSELLLFAALFLATAALLRLKIGVIGIRKQRQR